MKINSSIDSNAVAIDVRNFGALPPHLTRDWMVGLAAAKNSKLKHPAKAIIELINSCNLDCPMCRVGQFGVNFDRIMPFADFQKVISQINGLQTVRLNGLGESTLVPELEKYLDYLFAQKIKVELITNGSGKVEIYKKILDNGGSVIISWDAAEPQLFEKLRRPAKWEIFVNKIKDLTNAAGDRAENIALLFTLQKENIRQLPLLVPQSSDWRIRKIIVNAVKDNGCGKQGAEIQEMISNIFRQAGEEALKHGIKLFLPAQVWGNKIQCENSYRTNSEGCKIPWKEVVIRWNGDVQPCNMFNPYVYGNIHLNSFDNIWNNLFADLFREMSNIAKKHPYCNDCVYFDEGYN